MKYTLNDLIAFVKRANSFEKLAIAEDWLTKHIKYWRYIDSLCETVMEQGLKLEKEYEKAKEIQGILKEIEEDDREIARRKIYGC